MTFFEYSIYSNQCKIAPVDLCSLNICYLLAFYCKPLPRICLTLAYLLVFLFGCFACSTPKTKKLEDLSLGCRLVKQLKPFLESSVSGNLACKISRFAIVNWVCDTANCENIEIFLQENIKILYPSPLKPVLFRDVTHFEMIFILIYQLWGGIQNFCPKSKILRVGRVSTHPPHNVLEKLEF